MPPSTLRAGLEMESGSVAALLGCGGQACRDPTKRRVEKPVPLGFCPRGG